MKINIIAVFSFKTGETVQCCTNLTDFFSRSEKLYSIVQIKLNIVAVFSSLQEKLYSVVLNKLNNISKNVLLAGEAVQCLRGYRKHYCSILLKPG